MELSIVICTYNRGELLRECLQSLSLQKCPKELFEVLIIDNNSTDITKEICKHFVNKNKNFRYLQEFNQGLSYARNLGFKNSKADWVAYVDDDAKSHINYVERALWVINNYNFDCFGGVFNAWYTQKKPKWISEEFGSNRGKQNNTGVLKTGHIDGGNMVWKKTVLQKLGGFPTEIGMIGREISYGEETYLQELAKKEGLIIGFDPELQIDHYVQPYKLNVFWHIKSAYKVGFDFWKTFHINPTKKDATLWNYQYIIRNLLIDIIKGLGNFIRKYPYYWQSYILEFVPYAILIGKLKSARKIVNEKNT